MVERRAEAVDVAPRAVHLLLDLLGGDVVGRAPELLHLPLRSAARDAEVHELRVHVLVEEDVVRLHVAVEEPDLLRRLEALGDLHPHAQHEGRVEDRLVRDERPEVAARDELHLEVRVVALLAEGVDLRHVRVVEARRVLRLVLERLERLLVVAQRLLHHLHGDLAPERLVLAEEGGPHAARSEAPQEREVRELRRHARLRVASGALDLGERREPADVDLRPAGGALHLLEGLHRDLVFGGGGVFGGIAHGGGASWESEVGRRLARGSAREARGGLTRTARFGQNPGPPGGPEGSPATPNLERCIICIPSFSV